MDGLSYVSLKQLRQFENELSPSSNIFSGWAVRRMAPCPAHPSRRSGDRSKLRIAIIRHDDDRTRTRRHRRRLLILSAVVNVVAGIVFISMPGLTGAAIATTIALIVWNVARALFISRHLRFLPGVFGMLGSRLRRSLGPRKAGVVRLMELQERCWSYLRP